MRIDYMDCHADTLTEIPAGENLWKNSCNLDLQRVRAFAETYTQIFAIWKDRKKMAHGAVEEQFRQMYDRAVCLLKEQDEFLSWCLDADDVRAAHTAGKAAALLSIEDVSIMGGMAWQMRELGFRFAMLSWNYENEYACGAAAFQRKGLTQEGRRLAAQLLEQGIVLDISHLSDYGVEDILSMTDRPVIASHSDVRKVCVNPRNLQTIHIKELIHRRALLGFNFYAPFIGGKFVVTDFMRHLDAVLELGGEEIIALGGDFDGCDNQFMGGITGVESVSHLWEMLEKAGYDEKLLEQLFFENANRFVMENVV